MARVKLLLACLLAAGCAGPGAQQRRALAELYSAGDYLGAAQAVKAARREYGAANEVAYRLDLGLALIDAGRLAEADAELARAQERMEELWTLSVSKRAGAALANENVDDYRGEAFERTLSHVMRALALRLRGESAEALVEAKNVESFLDRLSGEASRGRSYRDDGFARWLAARFYEELGRSDDARISDEAARGAYSQSHPSRKDSMPGPAFGEGEAEALVVLLDGPPPRKRRQAGKGALGILLQTSYPAYESAPSAVSSCEASLGGEWAAMPVVEDVLGIAAKDLEERLTALKARSSLRAAVKLAGSAFGVDARDSEFADVRGWSNLPSRIRLARLRGQPGAALLRLRCRDAAGEALFEKSSSLRLKNGERIWNLFRSAL